MVTKEMILTATQDILTGSHIASSTVILAAALHEISVKVACPWFVQNCSYLIRTAAVALLTIGGLVIIMIASDVHWRLVGVGVACGAGALGEITFLALTSFYGDIAASAVAAGIGMSSMLGPYLYTAMTTWACVAPRTVFGIIAPFVLLLLVSFYSLPKDHLPERQNSDMTRQSIKYVPLETNTDSEPQISEDKSRVIVERNVLSCKRNLSFHHVHVLGILRGISRKQRCHYHSGFLWGTVLSQRPLSVLHANVPLGEVSGKVSYPDRIMCLPENGPLHSGTKVMDSYLDRVRPSLFLSDGLLVSFFLVRLDCFNFVLYRRLHSRLYLCELGSYSF
ncbi:hypothetical protein ACROYT_G012020 [Oculina patagonica]